MAKKRDKIMTVRLDPLRQERLARLAKWRGVAPSEAMRLAIDDFFLQENVVHAKTAYDRLKPWIGSIDSSKHMKGPATSDDASAQARALILEKWDRKNAKRPG